MRVHVIIYVYICHSHIFCYQQMVVVKQTFFWPTVGWSLKDSHWKLVKDLHSPFFRRCSTRHFQALSRFVASLQSSFGSLESAAKELSLGDLANKKIRMQPGVGGVGGWKKHPVCMFFFAAFWVDVVAYKLWRSNGCYETWRCVKILEPLGLLYGRVSWLYESVSTMGITPMDLRWWILVP